MEGIICVVSIQDFNDLPMRNCIRKSPSGAGVTVERHYCCTKSRAKSKWQGTVLLCFRPFLFKPWDADLERWVGLQGQSFRLKER